MDPVYSNLMPRHKPASTNIVNICGSNLSGSEESAWSECGEVTAIQCGDGLWGFESAHSGLGMCMAGTLPEISNLWLFLLNSILLGSIITVCPILVLVVCMKAVTATL